MLPERGPIRASFACTYPVRRRTTGSIHRKAVADSSAAAFRFSPRPHADYGPAGSRLLERTHTISIELQGRCHGGCVPSLFLLLRVR